jgi:hypothetical protein
MSWNFGEYDAQTIASHFDRSQSWYAEGSNDYTSKMLAVKSLNPFYQALMYYNVQFMDSSDPNFPLAQSSGWLLKRQDKTYDTSQQYPNLYHVDIGNVSYQQWVAALIKSRLDSRPWFDGVMADGGLTVDIRAFNDWRNWDTNPIINPRTGVGWRESDLLPAFLDLHTAIKNAIGSRLLMPNGIWNGVEFYDKYSAITDYLSKSPISGPMSEGCWYQGQGWMTEEDWLKSLNMVIWFQNNWLKDHPERILDVTCGSGPQWQMPPGATNEQMMLYGYSSLMLGVKYSHQTSMDFSLNQAESPIPTSLFQLEKSLHDLDMGTPLGDYYVISGTHVYARDFSNDKVLVNPSASSYTVSLGGNYKTLDGTTVSSITMSDHTGTILLKT